MKMKPGWAEVLGCPWVQCMWGGGPLSLPMASASLVWNGSNYRLEMLSALNEKIAVWHKNSASFKYMLVLHFCFVVLFSRRKLRTAGGLEGDSSQEQIAQCQSLSHPDEGYLSKVVNFTWIFF